MDVFICVAIVEIIINKFRLHFAFWINYLFGLRGCLSQLKGNCGGKLFLVRPRLLSCWDSLLAEQVSEPNSDPIHFSETALHVSHCHKFTLEIIYLILSVMKDKEKFQRKVGSGALFCMKRYRPWYTIVIFALIIENTLKYRTG